MGAFFSLRAPREWEQVIAATPEPSVWTNVGFSPLSRDRHMIFQRAGQAEFVFPSAIRRKGGDTMHPSDKAVVSLMIAFDESAGRFYSGLLFAAPEEALHRYCKSASSKALQKDRSTDAVGHLMSRPGSRMFSQYSSAASDGEEGDPRSEQGSPGGRARAAAVEARSPSTRTFLGRELGRPRSRTDSSLDAKSAAGKAAASPFEKLWEDTQPEPTEDSEWSFMLLYAVKEGVLVHFSNDRREAEEIVRAIATSYAAGTATSPDGARRPSEDGAFTMSPTLPAAPLLTPPQGKVQMVDQLLGPVVPPCARHLCTIIHADIARRFAARCAPEDQPEFTNCAAFCLRVLAPFKLSFRSHDIRRICEARAELGRVAGEAAGAACERLLKALRYDQAVQQPK